jgi:hypothetical protein
MDGSPSRSSKVMSRSAFCRHKNCTMPSSVTKKKMQPEVSARPGYKTENNPDLDDDDDGTTGFGLIKKPP